jgi:hypothetical protein
MSAASAGLKVFHAFRAGESEAKGQGSEEEANQVRTKLSIPYSIPRTLHSPLCPPCFLLHELFSYTPYFPTLYSILPHFFTLYSILPHSILYTSPFYTLYSILPHSILYTSPFHTLYSPILLSPILPYSYTLYSYTLILLYSYTLILYTLYSILLYSYTLFRIILLYLMNNISYFPLVLSPLTDYLLYSTLYELFTLCSSLFTQNFVFDTVQCIPQSPG